MVSSFAETAQLMTAEEVGRLLRLKPATVYEAASSGKIPSVRLWRGNRRDLVRFRRVDIEELIQKRTVIADEVSR